MTPAALSPALNPALSPSRVVASLALALFVLSTALPAAAVAAGGGHGGGGGGMGGGGMGGGGMGGGRGGGGDIRIHSGGAGRRGGMGGMGGLGSKEAPARTGGDAPRAAPPRAGAARVGDDREGAAFGRSVAAASSRTGADGVRRSAAPAGLGAQRRSGTRLQRLLAGRAYAYSRRCDRTLYERYHAPHSCNSSRAYR